MDVAEDLMEFGLRALEHALTIAGDGDTLIPFMLAEEDGEVNIKMLVSTGASSTDDLEAMARTAIAEGSGSVARYAVAAEAVITVGEYRHDAMIVEFGRSGEAEAHKIIQLFVPARPDRAMERVGEPTYMGRTASLAGGA